MTDEIDTLTDQVDDLLSKIDKLVGRRKADPGEYGDGRPVDDTWSQAGAKEEVNNDDDDDDEEDGDRKVRKASVNEVLRTNSPANRPGDLEHSTHTAPRHKFEALVDKVKNEEGIPRSQALAYCRMNFPDVYRSYQEHTGVVKSAPQTFEDLVNIEISKGCNAEVAGQRVMQLYGSTALRHRAMSKSDSSAETAEIELIRKAEDIWADSEGLDRCQSLRLARHQHQDLYRRMR